MHYLQLNVTNNPKTSSRQRRKLRQTKRAKPSAVKALSFARFYSYQSKVTKQGLYNTINNADNEIYTPQYGRNYNACLRKPFSITVKLVSLIKPYDG